MLSSHVARYVAFHRGLGSGSMSRKERWNFTRPSPRDTEIATHVSAELKSGARLRFHRRARVFGSIPSGDFALSSTLRIPSTRCHRHTLSAGAKCRVRRHTFWTTSRSGQSCAQRLHLPPKGTITPHTYHHLFGLLATTGLRISEALALQRDDLTDDGLIIRKAKFEKSRLVPIHATTRQALNNYQTIRTRLKSNGDDLFVVTTGRAPHQTTAWEIFVQLARQLGYRGPQGTRGPRLHDLRIPSPCAPSKRAPTIDRRSRVTSPRSAPTSVIPTWQGTYWYLEATPVLLHGIADATERLFRGDAA